MNSTIKSKLITVFLLALFIIPMLAAGIMYVTGKGIPHKTVNHGTLINPPLNFNTLSLSQTDKTMKLKGKWLLVYISPTPCTQQCLDTLYKIRQTHTALNKDSDRFVRVFVTTQPVTANLQQQIANTYPGTQYSVVSRNALTTFLTNSPNSAETLAKGRLYVVDPLGNVMMTYTLDIAFEPLLSDLKRLLQLSQIG